MSAFRFYARYALLTYAQCSTLDPFAVVEHLATMGAECIIGRETHADGGTHLHAFVDFGRRFHSRRASVFDVAGFHPNISITKRNPQIHYDYAIKDGEVVAGGLERPDGNAEPAAPNKHHEICLAPTREEFFESVRSLDPRLLLTSFNSLQAYADWNYRVDPEPYRHDPEHVFDTSRFPELQQWVEKYLGWDASVMGKLYRTLRLGGQSVSWPPPKGGGTSMATTDARRRPPAAGLAWRRQ